MKPPLATEAWMDQICSSTALQTPFNPALTTPAVATVASVAAPILHTTSSMPANLHLVNAPTTMVLSPAMTDPFFPAPPTVAITTAASVGNGGKGGGAVFLPSVSDSSGSSGPVLTAEGSSCSIPASSVGQIVERTEDGLVAMEVIYAHACKVVFFGPEYGSELAFCVLSSLQVISTTYHRHRERRLTISPMYRTSSAHSL